MSKKKFMESQLEAQQYRQEASVLRMQLDSCTTSLTTATEGLIETREEAEADRLIWQTEKDVLLTQINMQGIELSEMNEALGERAARLQELENRLDEQTQATRALRRTVADALGSFSSEELQVSIEDGRVKVSLSENLLFPSASVNLDPKGVDALGKLAEVLKVNPDVNIMIVGYTDSLAISTPRFRNNWDLSVLRATTIASILQERYRIDGSRLTASGQAEFQPVASNGTEQGRALNRRTEIFLIPKLDALMEVLIEDQSTSEAAAE
ncbi:MAG: OmpA family protein [Flavobacteriia bacterium]|nr:OmpA family protein [Flavobacteriia bacterium]